MQGVTENHQYLFQLVQMYSSKECVSDSHIPPVFLLAVMVLTSVCFLLVYSKIGGESAQTCEHSALKEQMKTALSLC